MQSGKAMLLPPYNSSYFHDPKMILELCTSDDKPCIFHKTNKMWVFPMLLFMVVVNLIVCLIIGIFNVLHLFAGLTAWGIEYFACTPRFSELSLPCWSDVVQLKRIFLIYNFVNWNINLLLIQRAQFKQCYVSK